MFSVQAHLTLFSVQGLTGLTWHGEVCTWRCLRDSSYSSAWSSEKHSCTNVYMSCFYLYCVAGPWDEGHGSEHSVVDICHTESSASVSPCRAIYHSVLSDLCIPVHTWDTVPCDDDADVGGGGDLEICWWRGGVYVQGNKNVTTTRRAAMRSGLPVISVNIWI